LEVGVFDNPGGTSFRTVPLVDTYEAIAKQLEAGSLAPEPAALTGARIGYARRA
jgi:hypothetical protein